MPLNLTFFQQHRQLWIAANSEWMFQTLISCPVKCSDLKLIKKQTKQTKNIFENMCHLVLQVVSLVVLGLCSLTLVDLEIV